MTIPVYLILARFVPFVVGPGEDVTQQIGPLGRLVQPRERFSRATPTTSSGYAMPLTRYQASPAYSCSTIRQSDKLRSNE